MLTVDLRRLGVTAGDVLLDVGCGGGRHTYPALRTGAHVVAVDIDRAELVTVASTVAAMRADGVVDQAARAATVGGDIGDLPFPPDSFDQIIAAEILEHIPDDLAAMAELRRVLRPGGRLAVTVPAFWPERICWAMSQEYHSNPGGHIRIYTRAELEAKLTATGFTVTGHHLAHGLHAPYWWLKCAVGVRNDAHPLPAAYHRMLVWDLMRGPAVTRIAEAMLTPVIGKSLVVYLTKPANRLGNAGARPAAAGVSRG